MTHFSFAALLGLLALSVPAAAQEAKPLSQPAPAAKVYDVPKDGLEISGKLTKDDPPLAGAPIATRPTTSGTHDPRLPELTAAERKLAADAKQLGEESVRLARAGRHREALAKQQLALAIQRQLYTPARFPDGHPELVLGLTELGFLLRTMGLVEPSLARFEEALAMTRTLYPASKFPRGHQESVKALTNIGFLWRATGAADKAMPYFEQALDICTRLYPETEFPSGHPQFALCHNNFALSLQAVGANERALPHFKRALAMRRQLYPEATHPSGHPDIAQSLNNIALLHQAMANYESALLYFDKAVAMTRQLYPTESFPDGHDHIAFSLNNLGTLHQDMGELDKAAACHQEAMSIRRTLYPPGRYPLGHPLLASSLNNLASVLRANGEYDKALPYTKQALAMGRTLYPELRFPQGHPDLVTFLSNHGSLLQSMGKHEAALLHFEKALALTGRLYPETTFPKGHAQVALVLNNVSTALMAMGAHEKALPIVEATLAMRRNLFPPATYVDGHPDVAQSLTNYGSLLEHLSAFDKALTYHQQALAMWKKLYPESKYPNGHRQLAISLNNLGNQLSALGSYEQALPHLEQALIIWRKQFPKSRYPDGHPELAKGLNNLGVLLHEMREFDKATPYFEQALTIYQTLYPESKYPDGHHQLAVAHSNLGLVLRSRGALATALPHFEQALAMERRLHPPVQYPRGHAYVAQSMNNFSVALRETGDLARALRLSREALDINRLLYPASTYPDGHAELVISLNNLGVLLQVMQRHEAALPLFHEAHTLERKLGERLFATASEAEALDFVHAQMGTVNDMLSCSLHLPETAATAYESVWFGKSVVTRLLEQRQAAARTAGADHAAKLDELKAKRRRIDQLLQDRNFDADERDKLLSRVSGERDQLERELAKALPLLARAKELAALGPKSLVTLLPKDAVFVDLVHYTRFDNDPKKLGKAGERQTPSYVAFILAPQRKEGNLRLTRVELGEAAPIDRAVARWRAAIERRTANSAANELHDAVWTKLAPHLSAGTRILYLAADGDLARVPWAALPVGHDRVLLEDYAIAVVPHGLFLLGQLKHPHEVAGPDSMLAVGGIEYGAGAWPPLPGAAVEVETLALLTPHRPIILTKSDASPAKLSKLLPTVRYAHLATHGAFQAEALAAEKNRAVQSRRTRSLGDETRLVAAKNPLAFVGVVLAGGEVLSGLSLVDLPLENLKLVTLSACETGLGEYTGGEGVQGLQRAFHLAGCPNVVASLWKVNDSATAALMAKFYHEMWVNKKPPIEALREAQLTIYRHPELIPDLAGERGAPRLKEAVAVRAGAPATGADKHADTKLWAAFVLSGVGK